MGKIKYLKDIRAFFKDSPVVSIVSLKNFIKKQDKRYVYSIINALLKKEEIKQLTRGYYTIHDESSLIVFCFKPSYLGLQDALSIHNLWEQETNPVVITTRKVRQGLRKIFGDNNYVLHRISPKYFFGFDYVQYGNFYFPVSDIEKTLIDLVYYHMHIDKETLREFNKRIDKKKLQEYLKHYPQRFRLQVEKMIGVRKELEY